MNSRFNIFRLITSNHDWIYFGGLCLLAFSMPVSPFALSVSQFILAGNWLVEMDFKRKFRQIKSQPALLIFLSVFLVHVIGLFYSTDWSYGLLDIKKKLPLLEIPVILATLEKLSPKKLSIVLGAFILGVFSGTIISFAAYLGALGFEYVDVREISIFISHIRFSIFIVLAIAILLFSFSNIQEKRYKIGAILFVIWFHFFLFVLQAYTGIVLVFLVDFIFLSHILMNRLSKVLGISIGLSLLFIAAGYSAFQIIDVLKILEVKESCPPTKDLLTKYGNKYTFYLPEPVTENGYHIYWYISRPELDTAWLNRSSVPLFGDDKKDQTIYYTLIRYLSSKGLRKDADGVQKLSQNDIGNIENGIANYLYPEFNPIKRRTFQIFWEIDNYLKGGNPTNHSVSQRIEFFKAGYNIFLKNIWFGVGTGDVVQAYQKYYSSSDTRLDKENQLRAHNQYLTFYLTFGVFLGTWIVVALILPLILKRKTVGLIVVVFLLIVFLSMLAEDTLESQAGVTFFSYFYSLFLFGSTKKS